MPQQKKDPLLATSDPSTWTTKQKIGATVFCLLVLCGFLFALSKGDWSLAGSIIAGGIVTGLICRQQDGRGNIFKMTSTLLRDINFDNFIIIDIVSIVYFVAIWSFWTVVFETVAGVSRDGQVNWMLIPLALLLLIAFRILLELSIAIVKIADNSSSG